MSNPLRAPTERANFELASDKELPPDALFRESPGYRAVFDAKGPQGYAAVERHLLILGRLDMEPRNAVAIPMEHCSVVVTRSAGVPYALANKGRPQFRLRSGPAHALMKRIWKCLPEGGVPEWQSREVIRAAMVDKFFVDGGTEMTLGRLSAAYPAKGVRPAMPVTRDEAVRAVKNCGIWVKGRGGADLSPYPLVAAEGEEAGIRVNPKSDNGFPVLGKWESPEARALILPLAKRVRAEIERAVSTPMGVGGWKKRMEHTEPWLVALRGKAKADYYSAEKINEFKMRFYNAFPRQILLNMQVATQPLEALSESVLHGSRSGIGLNLTRGGAQALVEAMDGMLDREEEAYVHVGDDSFVVVRVGGSKIVLFALDCSNFDLTQHASVTEEVHKAIREQLREIDVPAADLWFAYARERLVVTANRATFLWKHAGPSGMPLQSKVNDALMDVAIRRVLTAKPQWTDEAAVNAAIEKAGQGMGFKVKVEQYSVLEARTLKEALAQRPFQFIGNYFHVLGGEVLTCCDLPRTLAQMPYPGLKWIKGRNGELEIVEAMRLGSMYLSAGIPPVSLEPLFRAWKEGALELIDRVLAQHGDVQDPKLRWAVAESPWGPQVEGSLKGLRAAVARDERELWAPRPEGVRVETPQNRPPGGVPGPKAAKPPKPEYPLAHPTTLQNVGRTPPTARWAPDKPPRAAMEVERLEAKHRRQTGAGGPSSEASSDDVAWVQEEPDDLDLTLYDTDYDEDWGYQ